MGDSGKQDSADKANTPKGEDQEGLGRESTRELLRKFPKGLPMRKRVCDARVPKRVLHDEGGGRHLRDEFEKSDDMSEMLAQEQQERGFALTRIGHSVHGEDDPLWDFAVQEANLA